MRQRTWLVLGASSIIAEKFAHIAAQSGHGLLLAGRQINSLNGIANDIKLRYQVHCNIIVVDLANQINPLLTILQNETHEIDIFIAHSEFTENGDLNTETITQLIKTNILATTLLVHTYFNRQQKEYHLLFLSSVAACRGRAKNSLYGATKACIEVYLQGLQQAAPDNQHITLARLGFIDTKQTYSMPGVFYAASPHACAKACMNALTRRKRMIYYPFFWRTIMAIITRLPFFLYKNIKR